MNSTCLRPTDAGARPAKSHARPTLLVTTFALTAVAVLAGCGTAATNIEPTTSVAKAVNASPATATSISSGPGQATTSISAADLSAAENSALALFVRLPLNASNPSQGYVWISGPASASHLSTTVRARLIELSAAGYFSDQPGSCGENYITATQNGLFSAPLVLSGVENSNGSVTVVIRRSTTNLTAVMTRYGQDWLASDLQSGTGASASIFSAKPNC